MGKKKKVDDHTKLDQTNITNDATKDKKTDILDDKGNKGFLNSLKRIFKIAFGKGGDGSQMDTLTTWLTRAVLFIFALLLVCVMLDIFNATYYDCTNVDYTIFQQQLEEGKVDVVFLHDASSMRWVLKEDTEPKILENREKKIAKGEEVEEEYTVDERNAAASLIKKQYACNYPSYDDFRKEILSKGVLINYRSFDSWTVRFLNAMLMSIPVVLMVVLLGVLLMSQNMFGSAKMALAASDKSVSFNDIIGLDESIEDIKFTIKVLKNKKLREKFNLKAPKGLLLSGPPGTGKTMIARAISNELKIKMIYVDSSSIIQLYVGLGAQRIREVFRQAKKEKPCIIFFDEIDAIGQVRGDKRSNSENDQTLNALLQELDGFDSDDGIFVIGATNLDGNLDKALVRPGRFDKKIMITPPRDWNVRKKMYEHYLEGEDVSEIDFDTIARQSSGFTGADIQQITNEAKMIAVANELDKITTKTIEEAIDKVWFKGSRTKNNYDLDRKIVAYHESGHALSSIINGLPVARISVIPNTSGVGGMVVGQENSESMFSTREELIKKIKMAYGGRIAEEIIFGSDKVTTGARQDIVAATEQLRQYVEEYGFDNQTGLIAVHDLLNAGYAIKESVTGRIQDLAKQLYSESYNEIKENVDILEKVAERVKEEETIDGETLTSYVQNLLKSKKLLKEDGVDLVKQD